VQNASGSNARSVPASATCPSSAGSKPHAAISARETHDGACITYMPQACRQCSAASFARRATATASPASAPTPCDRPEAAACSAASHCASTDPTRSTTVRASASGTRRGPRSLPLFPPGSDCWAMMVGGGVEWSGVEWSGVERYMCTLRRESPGCVCKRSVARTHPRLRLAPHPVHPAPAPAAVVLLGQALEDAEEQEQGLELPAQVCVD
jgi:hypothetical protein